MESIHSPKKPGAARVGILAVFLLLALLLALPCAWYAVYHDQLAAPTAASVRYGLAPPSRPSGVISLPRPGPARAAPCGYSTQEVKWSPPSATVV